MTNLKKQLIELFPELLLVIKENDETNKLVQKSEEVIERVISNNNKILSSRESMENCVYRMNELIKLTEVESDNKKDA